MKAPSRIETTLNEISATVVRQQLLGMGRVYDLKFADIPFRGVLYESSTTALRLGLVVTLPERSVLRGDGATGDRACVLLGRITLGLCPQQIQMTWSTSAGLIQGYLLFSFFGEEQFVKANARAKLELLAKTASRLQSVWHQIDGADAGIILSASSPNAAMVAPGLPELPEKAVFPNFNKIRSTTRTPLAGQVVASQSQAGGNMRQTASKVRQPASGKSRRTK